MLAKPLATRFIAGTPEVPYQAAHTLCGQTPAPGNWQTTCEGIFVPNGYQCPNGGVTSPSHDHSTDPILYTFFPTGPCRSEWVQTGPPGPVVCTNYPEVAHVPATPNRMEQYLDFGWNAGGNSINSEGGDCFIRDTMPAVAGVVWGFVTSRDQVPDLARITHGFMFSQTPNGLPLYRIVESGQAVVSERPYAVDDLFEIRRIAGRVFYMHAGAEVYASTKTSSGEVMVGSSIYGSGDTIP